MFTTTTITTFTEAMLCVIAFIVALAVYPVVLAFAKKHNIVDNPNARKLQRVPVPVMGGIAVSVGILVPVLIFNIAMNDRVMWVGGIAMFVMLIIGAIDDIGDIPATLRFILEVALVYGVIVIANISIDNLHGLWNVGAIPANAALPLSIIAGVGIINSVNLIDGVDGYSSGYGIMSCILFSIMAYHVGDVAMGRVAIISAGALLPFFLHNVFGYKSKMFIGDSGTLMMGALMTMFVFSVLSGHGEFCKLEEKGVGLVPFTLAVMAIPVFDTLRVMSVRIYRGVSPFHPDKTHLHHLFIDMGFSHIGTTFTILSVNFFVVLVWFLSWKLGASIDTQLYIVLAFCLFTTFFFYHFMRIQQRHGPKDEDGYPTGNKLWRFFCAMGDLSHLERRGFWGFMRRLMDGEFLRKR